VVDVDIEVTLLSIPFYYYRSTTRTAAARDGDLVSTAKAIAGIFRHAKTGISHSRAACCTQTMLATISRNQIEASQMAVTGMG
jgi:hypothetical protein